jgi:hypothetical protein
VDESSHLDELDRLLRQWEDDPHAETNIHIHNPAPPPAPKQSPIGRHAITAIVVTVVAIFETLKHLGILP